MLRLFDTHTHLQDGRVFPDVRNVLDRARATGIQRILCCACDPADWHRVEALTLANPDMVIPAFGIHPLHAHHADHDSWEASLRTLLQRYPDAAIGEVGLDHTIAPRHDAQQEEIFRAQLALAIEARRPLSIHCRRAWPSMLKCLETHAPFPAPFVLHAFSGPAEWAPRLTALGAYFSFSGACTNPRNRRAQKTMPLIPADRLLAETDTPDLFPTGTLPQYALHGEHSRVNEPANLPHIVHALAQGRGLSDQEMATILWDNAGRVFGPGALS